MSSAVQARPVPAQVRLADRARLVLAVQARPGPVRARLVPEAVQAAQVPFAGFAYVCALIATLYWYRQVSGGSIREALVPRLDDREHYLRILRRVMDRRGRVAVE